LRAAIALDASFPFFDEFVVLQGHVVTVRSYETGRFARDGKLVGREQDEFPGLLAVVQALKLYTKVCASLFRFKELELCLSMRFLLTGKGAKRFEMPSFFLLGFGEIGPQFVSFGEMFIVPLVFFVGTFGL